MVWVQVGKNKRDVMSGRSMSTQESKQVSFSMPDEIATMASPRDMGELKALNGRLKS